MDDASERIIGILTEAGLALEDTPAFTDDDLLAIPGVGKSTLRTIRELVPPDSPEEAPSGASDEQPDEPRPSEPEAEPSVETAPEPPAGCTCTGQKWKITRTRMRKGKLERYCEKCGAIKG